MTFVPLRVEPVMDDGADKVFTEIIPPVSVEASIVFAFTVEPTILEITIVSF